MEDCIFCKIIKGEIPCYKIYEDEKTFAFLDVSKDYFGHTLVVPKQHFKNIFDIDTNTLNAVFQTVQKISKHYKACGFDGVNIFNNNEKCASQSVFHLHIHIIPRKIGDNFFLFEDKQSENFDLEQMHNLLKIEGDK